MSCVRCGSTEVELVLEQEYLGEGTSGSTVKKRCGCGAFEVVSAELSAGDEPRPDWQPDFDEWKKDYPEGDWRRE